MINKRGIGDSYEQIAAAYLKSEGYTVLETNFTCRQGELDIIGHKDGYIRFIEVKYRQNARMGMPEEAVTPAKQRRISRAAAYYMVKKGLGSETACCFDVVAIAGEEIRLYENAFDYRP